MEQELVDEEEIPEVDLEMINRIAGSEDGYIAGEITDVSLSGNESFVRVTVSTPVGEKENSFRIPDVPSGDDDIVRLCETNNVDPKYPSLLEGFTVKIDEDDDIVIPELRRERVRSHFEEIFADPDEYYYPKMTFFFVFLPITLTTYYMVLHRKHRHVMRDDMMGFGMHILIWVSFIFAALIIFSGITTLF